MISMVVVWLIVMITMIVFEIISLGLTSIWFAGGALIALILAALKLPLWLQIVAFVISSILLLLITRPIAKKYLNKHVTRTNAESLIGSTAVVSQDIDNIMSTGEAMINGMPWMARSVDDEIKIAKGSKVEIMDIKGVKLIVKAKENN